MKRILSIIVVLCLCLVIISGCDEKKQMINISTGGIGGTYYPVGGAIAQTITENLEYINVNALVGIGSVANCNLIREGEVESALVQNNVAFWAYKGIGAFEGRQIEELRGIASLYPEAIQIIALADAGITSVQDLKGKKVCVGEFGSGVYFDVTNILAAHGMSEDDLQVDYLSFSEASQKLIDKEIDAAFLTSGYPTSSVTDVNLARDIIIVPIADEAINKMIETSPFYSKTIIPAGTYRGIDVDIQTATTMATWVVSSKVSEDVVYDMTKALWENRDEVEFAHEKGKNITIETALDGMGIPLHPGAQRYYDEKGIN